MPESLSFLPMLSFRMTVMFLIGLSSVQFSRSVMSDFVIPWTAVLPAGLPVHHQLPEFNQTHVH